MGTAPSTLLHRFAYPRLTAVIALGLGLLGIAAVLYLLGPVFGGGLRSVGLQIALVGYLVVIFGGSGRIAFAVFHRAR